METTVTAVFREPEQAERARQRLAAAGFAAGAIEQIDSATPDRHELIGEETTDLVRGVVLGAVVGAVGLGVGGVAMAGPIALFELSAAVAAALFGVLGLVAGGLIGLLIGSATGHQVQEEYEFLIDHGAVLLAVNTDHGHAQQAQQTLRESGGQRLSTSVHRAHRDRGDRGAQQSA